MEAEVLQGVCANVKETQNQPNVCWFHMIPLCRLIAFWYVCYVFDMTLFD